MKHLGDITKINGYEVPEVDIICGGSPCQDLSVAGKRAGLAGERSGLFMEQIRIIKEMRKKEIENGKANDNIRPRYMVWENVPGAFSSNKGEDFRAVLEETAKIVEKDAVIPEPEKGKWTPAGCIVGDGWSIAWRLHDAQFWGVPQRRKRISLVADFGGQSAPEILFERDGMSGNIETCGEKRQGTSEDVERCVGKTGYGVVTKGNGDAFINPDTHMSLSVGGGQAGQGYPCVLETQNNDSQSYTLKIRGGVDVDSNGKKAGKGPLIQTELSGTLGVSQDQTLFANIKKNEETLDGNNDSKAVVYGITSYESNSMKSSNPHSGIYQADTSRTLDLNGGNPACNQGGMAVVEQTGAKVIGFNRGNGSGIPAMEEKQPTLQAAAGESGNNQPLVCVGETYSVDMGAGKSGCNVTENITATLACTHGGEPVVLESNQNHATTSDDGISPTLPASMGMGGGYVPMITDNVYCLQGNGIDRADTAGCNGKGWRENESYTLNTIDRPAVCYRKQGHPQNAEQGQGWEETDVNDTLNAFDTGEMRTPTVVTQAAFENHSQDTRYRPLGEVCSSVSATYGMGGNNQPFVVKQVYDASRRHNYEEFGDVCETVQAHYGTGGGNVPMVMEKETYQDVTGTLSPGAHAGSYNGQDAYNDMLVAKPSYGIDCFNQTQSEEVTRTLLAGRNDKKSIPCTYGIDCYNQTQTEEQTMSITSAATDPHHIPCTYGLDRASFNQGKNAKYDFSIEEEKIGAQVSRGPGAVCQSIVRRLTPMECERLQGYPDHWTDIGEWVDSKGKKHKDADSPRYKALGNSIALPFWEWMAHRMCSYLKEPTMASLFDGIGGFPLVFSRAGCKPIWASEIEEFPIAVTKIRFPENE